MQALGVDLQNGTALALTTFRDGIGATFPMLLNGASSTGGNVATLYGDRDNYVVISKQGIVRYHAALKWPYGGRYRRDEIRGCIDSLVSTTVSVDPAPPLATRLSLWPNPAAAKARVTLAVAAPVARARVAVFDVAGRLVALLYEGRLAPGPLELEWDGTGAAPGVYPVVAELDGRRIERRLVRIR